MKLCFWNFNEPIHEIFAIACTKPVKIKKEFSVLSATVGSIKSVVLSRPLDMTS